MSHFKYAEEYESNKEKNMNTRDVLTLCATLVVGGAFIAGSANALSSPYEQTPLVGNTHEDARENAFFDRSLGNIHEDARENALFDRSIEKANKGNKAAKHDRKAASLANQGYSAGGVQPAQSSSLNNSSSSAAVAVPEPSTLMLLGSVLLGFATLHFRQRKSVAVLHHTDI
jgi:PEP-CTERM motif-containing protein